MNSESHYVICIKNDGYKDDLKLRTVYQILPDESAERSHYLRVIDETGEDYLFPADYFVPIAVPAEAEHVLFAA
jgi:hypothetical protein